MTSNTFPRFALLVIQQVTEPKKLMPQRVSITNPYQDDGFGSLIWAAGDHRNTCNLQSDNGFYVGWFVNLWEH